MTYARLAAIVLLGLWPISGVAKPLPMMDAMSVMDAVHAKVGHNDDLNASLVGEGNYAIAFWKKSTTHAAGAALVKKSAGTWQVLNVFSAIPTNAAALQGAGVPAVQAKALIVDIQNNSE